MYVKFLVSTNFSVTRLHYTNLNHRSRGILIRYIFPLYTPFLLPEDYTQDNPDELTGVLNLNYLLTRFI